MAGENEREDLGQNENSDINNKVFDTVERLLRGAGMTNTPGDPVTLEMHSSEGQMDAQQVKELLNMQESLRLSDAEVGDVVWWIDTKGMTGYFRITKKYGEAESKGSMGPGPDSGRGAIRLERPKRIIESNDAYIWGATFSGSMLKAGQILMNVPLELTIDNDKTQSMPQLPWNDDYAAHPKTEQAKAFYQMFDDKLKVIERNRFFTQPVINMGIIRVAQLKDAPSK